MIQREEILVCHVSPVEPKAAWYIVLDNVGKVYMIELEFLIVQDGCFLHIFLYMSGCPVLKLFGPTCLACLVP